MRVLPAIALAVAVIVIPATTISASDFDIRLTEDTGAFLEVRATPARPATPTTRTTPLGRASTVPASAKIERVNGNGEWIFGRLMLDTGALRSRFSQDTSLWDLQRALTSWLGAKGLPTSETFVAILQRRVDRHSLLENYRRRGLLGPDRSGLLILRNESQLPRNEVTTIRRAVEEENIDRFLTISESMK